MSERSHIGIKTGTKIEFIYCHHSGSLSENGVLLNMFYKDVNKVQELISLGDISSLGYNIKSPNGFSKLSDYAKNQVNCLMDTHIKTSFVYAYSRDKGEKDVGKPSKTNLKNFLLHGEEYNYLFDVDKKKWYLCYMVQGKKVVYDLNSILTNKDYFDKCVLEVGIEDDFQRIQEKIAMYKADLKVDIITKYNTFLRKNDVFDVEIDYVQKDGERMFGLLKREVGKQRRKVVMKHPCIGYLCYELLSHCKGAYFIYNRLSCAETCNLIDGDIPLF